MVDPDYKDPDGQNRAEGSSTCIGANEFQSAGQKCLARVFRTGKRWVLGDQPDLWFHPETRETDVHVVRLETQYLPDLEHFMRGLLKAAGDFYSYILIDEEFHSSK